MESIVQRVARTRFSRRQLNYYAMFVWVSLIRMHICTILCILIQVDPAVDFFVHVIIPILLFYCSPAIRRVIDPCKKRSYDLVSTVVKEYSHENFKFWKKVFVVCFTAYCIFILQFVDVSSDMLVVFLLQNLLYCGIIDFIEEKKYTVVYNQCRRRWYSHRHHKIRLLEGQTRISIQENHIPNISGDKPQPRSQPNESYVVAVRNKRSRTHATFKIPYFISYLRKKKRR